MLPPPNNCTPSSWKQGIFCRRGGGRGQLLGNFGYLEKKNAIAIKIVEFVLKIWDQKSPFFFFFHFFAKKSSAKFVLLVEGGWFFGTCVKIRCFMKELWTLFSCFFRGKTSKKAEFLENMGFYFIKPHIYPMFPQNSAFSTFFFFEKTWQKLP